MGENTVQPTPYFFLKGGGKMGELTRNFDWSKTPLGTPDTWPQSLRSYVNLLLNSRFPMFLFWGPELRCFYNDAYRPRLGTNGKHPGLLGMKGKEAFPEAWDFIGPLIEGILAGGEATFCEDQSLPIYRNGDLENGYWTFSYSAVVDEAGSPAGVFVTCTETTKAVLDFRQMQESEARFRTLVENAISPIFVLKGEDMVLEMANQPLFDVWDVDESVLGKPFLEILPEMKDQPFLHWMRQVYHSGKAFTKNEVPAHFIRKNGEVDTRYWNFIYQPYFEQDGTVSGVLAQATEITEQVVSHKVVEESEARFRSLVEEAPVATCLYVGKDMRIEVINDMMIGYMGKGRFVIGKPLAEALPEIKDQPFLQILDAIYTSGETFQAMAAPAQLAVNGVMRNYYFDYTFKPLKNAAGEVYGIVNMGVDVTEQVLAKQSLEESERALRSFILQAPIAIAILRSKDYVVEIVNVHALEFWGRTAEEVTGQPLFDCLPELRTQGFREFFDNIYDSGLPVTLTEHPIRFERAGKMDDFYFNFLYQVLYGADGKVNGIMVVGVDMTLQTKTRMKIEEAVAERTKALAAANLLLKQSNRELEQFAYIASHDLQEPLRKVSTFTEMLKNHLGEADERSATYFNKITSATLRMMQLIRDVLDFSQLSNKRQVFEKVDISVLIENLAADFELVIEQKKAVIRYRDLPVLTANPLQMRQLFGNLLSNALKFTKEGEAPVISISSKTLSVEEKAAHKDLLPEEDYCLITIADNGIGFGEEHAERIFSIFQRLHGKSEFEGTGIGLALCKKIAQNHRGDIWAMSEKGKGASFHIILPCPQDQ